jgi:hypothetical protein
MTDRQFREREVQIAHYQLLSREVTDPLAACLLRVVIEELEADLRKDRDYAAWLRGCQIISSRAGAVDGSSSRS